MTEVPTNMRQIIFDGAGGPEVCKLVRAEVPHPSAGQVLIKVAAAGINRPDVAQRGGFYPPPAGETSVPGLEVAGEVIACGPDVTSPRIGEKVCALVGSGGYAEYALAHAGLCMAVPAPLTLTEAAGIPENLFHGLRQCIHPRTARGETKRFLVHGGSSGIGSTSIQLAKAMGARVIATAGFGGQMRLLP